MTAAHETGRVTYQVLDGTGFADSLDDLGALLADAVESGSAVNFVLPFSDADGVAWWTARTADVASGATRAVIARLDGRLAGVVLLVKTGNPNAPHRAEIQKVLVHRRARGQGIGSELMRRVEELALAEGRWLLILDTQTGSDAERMYRRLGWQVFGVVPDHSLRADGEAFLPTTFFYKDLRAEAPR